MYTQDNHFSPMQVSKFETDTTTHGQTMNSIINHLIPINQFEIYASST